MDRRDKEILKYLDGMFYRYKEQKSLCAIYVQLLGDRRDMWTKCLMILPSEWTRVRCFSYKGKIYNMENLSRGTTKNIIGGALMSTPNNKKEK